MSHKCCVLNCKSSVKENPSLSMFRLPVDAARCDVWLTNIGREDLKSWDSLFLYKNRRVCSLHFEDCMFAGLSRAKLKRDAEPTIFQNNGLLSKQSETVIPAEDIEVDPSSTQNEQLIITNIINTEEIRIETPNIFSATSPCKKKLRKELNKYENEMNELSINTSSQNLITNEHLTSSNKKLRKDVNKYKNELSINTSSQNLIADEHLTSRKQKLRKELNKYKKEMNELSINTSPQNLITDEHLTSPRNKKIRKELKKYKKKVNQLSINTSSQNLITDDQFKMFCEVNFQPALAKFMIAQLDILRSNHRGVSYSEAYKQFTLTGHFLDPTS